MINEPMTNVVLCIYNRKKNINQTVFQFWLVNKQIQNGQALEEKRLPKLFKVEVEHFVCIYKSSKDYP